MSFWENYILKLKEVETLGASVFVVGKSVLKRPIFCVKVGSGKKKILVQCAIHAREHITLHLAFVLIKSLLRKNVNASVYVIPLANPDGVCLATDGLKSVYNINNDFDFVTGHFAFLEKEKPFSVFYRKKIAKNLEKINPSKNFYLWKANINGVDLNVNFNAKWGMGKHNVFHPESANFVGKMPEDQPETQALVCFTKTLKPNLTISYHCKGEVLFYLFGQKGCQKARDKKIAKEVSKTTGYKIKKAKRSVGGFKDWCITHLKIPALTIEVGAEKDAHPLKRTLICEIWAKNRLVITNLLALLK